MQTCSISPPRFISSLMFTVNYSQHAERERAAKEKLYNVLVKAKAKLDSFETAHPDWRQPDCPLLVPQQHENAQYMFKVLKHIGTLL